jgi:hypothetical protein
MMILKYLRIFLLILLVACGKTDPPQAKDYYEGILVSQERDILIPQINLDSIILENIPSSFVGYIRVFSDTVFFVDYLQNRVFPITIDGKIYPFRIGTGKSPKEFFGGVIHDFTFLADNSFLIQGTSWDLHFFSDQWEFIEMKRVNWQSSEPVAENEIPDPQNPYLYSFNYITGRDKCRLLGNYIFCEVSSFHPLFNMINSRDYYRRSKLIAKLDVISGVVVDLLGLRSLAFENYEFIGHFSRAIFDVAPAKQQFFLGFEPDPLIYVCDSSFKPIRAFGLNGLQMNQNYSTYKGNDFNEVEKIFRKDQVDCGTYTSLEYIEERDLLFRSYSRGSHSHYDGLQIYRNEVLIADVDVPKGFKVEGYLAPYFISSFFQDSLYESGKIYLFQLDF